MNKFSNKNEFEYRLKYRFDSPSFSRFQLPFKNNLNDYKIRTFLNC